MLNIDENIRKFGPLRNLWEGKILGEKILFNAKNEFLGFRPGWSRILLQRMINSIGIQKISHSKNTKKTKNTMFQDMFKKGHVKFYTSYDDIKGTHTYNEPLSIVRFEDGTFGVILQGINKSFFEIKCGRFVTEVTLRRAPRRRETV